MDKKYIRLLIDNTRFILTESSESIEYTRLAPGTTGLPYDIFIDNNRSYIEHNHELWLYVKCGDVRIPVTIEEHPKVKRFIYGYNFDLSPVYDFINKNQKLLISMANRTTNEHVFFHFLKRVDENQSKNRHVELLTEMATLHPSISLLPTTLWLDDDTTYLPHAPRIKFKMGFENTTREYTSMEINNPDKLHNEPSRKSLTTRQVEHIKHFVRANQQLLLDLANKKIDITTFKQQMKLVDANGNIINTKDVEIGNFVNGFAIYCENGKYNYVKEDDNSLLFPTTDLDFATPFNYYGNNILLAFVGKDNREFYIDNNGEEITFN